MEIGLVALFVRPIYLLSEPYARSAAVLVDELDAGALQRIPNFIGRLASASKWSVGGFQSLDGRYRNLGSRG